MLSFTKIFILFTIFNSYIINCKTKSKKKEKKSHDPYMEYFVQNYITPADLIRPTDVSRELFCDVCQAIFTEALKNLRNLHKESDVTYYLNNQKICAQENFEGYHFSKPEMEIGCEVFIGEYFDYVQKILIQRNPNKDTNITLINKFCYKAIRACNGVDLRGIKPIPSKIIDGELYDIEIEEKVHKVKPKIIDVDSDDDDLEMDNETFRGNSTEL